MESHLESATRKHLDLTRVKLNSSQVQLVKQQVQLDEARVQLDDTRVRLDETQVQLDETQAQLSSTQVQLKNTQETTRKLEEKLEALQTQLETKVNADKGADNKRFIWKIENFREILKQAKAGVKKEIVSDPFYTGCYGYKLKVIVLPYIEGLTQLDDSLYFGIASVESEYDDILPWPFRKKITFTVIDQNEDLKERDNITADLRPSSKAPIFCGRPTGHLSFDSDRMFFVPHKRLQTRRYLLNDNLFLQVDVGPDDWLQYNTQETTSKLEEKLEALQTQLETKVNADKGADNKRFIWKIENFNEILRQAKIVSVLLYTGCYGYKLEVLVRPYCKGSGHVF